ncbi:hypothetical protein NIES4075_57260 [Tolypothrix sp. NIES-4075]|nr:hypothetical protein NIES4075_57260 [Tolypothrix sp. NIES-4075]
MRNMEEYSYPIPDPAWDYAKTWHSLQEIKVDYERLLKYLADIEKATLETDAELKNRLGTIERRLNSTRQLLDD